MKRWISMLLAVVLVLGMFPMPVQAQQDTGTADLTNGDITVTGTNGFGNLLSQDLLAYMQTSDAETAENAGYAVNGLEIADRTATVRYTAPADAVLVVALYTEDRLTMYTSASTAVSARENSAAVTFEGDLPEFFQVTAYLVDASDMSPLCEAYNTSLYTREMQELLASTVDDYDPERVLNLDNDPTTNFAVFSDSTKIISGGAARSGAVNRVVRADDENRVYVIENADESVTSLLVGEVFAYPYEDNKLLIVKIASIEISGNTVTITGDDLEMDEVFDAVKIEADEDHYDVDPSTADAGIHYKTSEPPQGTCQPTAWEAEFTHVASSSIEFDIAEDTIGSTPIEVDGSLTMSLTTHISYYVTISYQTVDIKFDFAADFSLTLTGKREKASGFKLGSMRVYPLPCVYVGMTPEFLIRFSGSMTIEINAVKTTVGVHFEHTGNNWNVTAIREPIQPSFEIKLEAELFIGFSLTPTVKILEGWLADAKLEGEFGFKIRGTLLPISLEPTETEKHDCTECLDGEVFYVFRVTPSIRLLNSDRVRLQANLINIEFKFMDFYWSATHSEFAFGPCPWHTFRTLICVYDDTGAAMDSIPVLMSNGKTLTTNSKGQAVIYLSGGSYCASVDFGDSSAIRQFDVTNQAQKVIIQEGGSGWSAVLGDLSPSDFEWWTDADESGNCGKKAKWAQTEDGTLRIFGSGDMRDFVLGNQGIMPGWYDDRRNITRVIIGDDITSIGQFSFADCRNMTSITIGSSVASINVMALADCRSLTSVTIPDSVTTLKTGAFYGCKSLTDLTLGNGLTTIKETVFQECDSLISVSLPDSVTSIGIEAFAYCDNLANVTIPDSVTSIAESAFAHCDSLTSAVIGSGLTQLAPYIFLDCGKLSSVSIPSSVTSIGYEAFEYCRNLTDVYYGGTEEQWAQITINSGNSYLRHATIHYNSSGPAADPASDSGTALPDAPGKIGGQKSSVIPLGAYSGEIFTDSRAQNAAFFGLIPHAQYVILVVKSLETEDLLAPDNVLFMDQHEAPEGEGLQVRFIPREEVACFYTVAFGPARSDLQYAEITFPEMTADGELQAVNPTVVYNGETLVEGRDYTIAGAVDYTEAGTYTCYIRGIHNYTGLVECTYVVAESKIQYGDANGDGRVNSLDVILLRQYLADWDVEPDMAAADANGDGRINSLDVILLRQYLADWDVTLGPKS